MSQANGPHILLIMGSVRAGRRCPQIADWVLSIANRSDRLFYERIDLRDWPLPCDDEPGIPAMGAYDQEHTRAWSARIANADGFVIVSPQYNWGYPASLKNALDHLYKEWAGKPLVIVTYGGHGGGKCAQQLLEVAGALKMRAAATAPAITVPRQAIENQSPLSAEDLKPFDATVEQALSELAGMFAGAP